MSATSTVIGGAGLNAEFAVEQPGEASAAKAISNPIAGIAWGAVPKQESLPPVNIAAPVAAIIPPWSNTTAIDSAEHHAFDGFCGNTTACGPRYLDRVSVQPATASSTCESSAEILLTRGLGSTSANRPADWPDWRRDVEMPSFCIFAMSVVLGSPN